MVLENVKEMWTDAPKAGGAAAKGAGARRARVARDRFVPKMFLRGDSVILVLRNPKWMRGKGRSVFLPLVRRENGALRFLLFLFFALL
jgi:hypothetical protein